MLGYQRGVKGYRLWFIEPGNQKVAISRDMVFIEDQMPYLSKEKQKEKVPYDMFEVELGK